MDDDEFVSAFYRVAEARRAARAPCRLGCDPRYFDRRCQDCLRADVETEMRGTSEWD